MLIKKKLNTLRLHLIISIFFFVSVDNMGTMNLVLGKGEISSHL